MGIIDKYIQCENIIIVLDVFLHRLEVLRHLLFNTIIQPLVCSFKSQIPLHYVYLYSSMNIRNCINALICM